MGRRPTLRIYSKRRWWLSSSLYTKAATVRAYSLKVHSVSMITVWSNSRVEPRYEVIGSCSDTKHVLLMSGET